MNGTLLVLDFHLSACQDCSGNFHACWDFVASGHLLLHPSVIYQSNVVYESWFIWCYVLTCEESRYHNCPCDTNCSSRCLELWVIHSENEWFGEMLEIVPIDLCDVILGASVCCSLVTCLFSCFSPVLRTLPCCETLLNLVTGHLLCLWKSWPKNKAHMGLYGIIVFPDGSDGMGLGYCAQQFHFFILRHNASAISVMITLK